MKLLVCKGCLHFSNALINEIKKIGNFTSMKLFLVLGLLMSFHLLLAQEDDASETETTSYAVMTFGGDLQAYPTGIVLNARYEQAIKWNHGINFNIGYNRFSHPRWGVHDVEHGGGPGVSVGYRYYIRWGLKRYFVGGNVGLWYNRAQWKDNEDTPKETSGNSNLLTLHYIAETGYCWIIKNLPFGIAPYFAIGAKRNVKTDGDDIREGVLFILGINLNFRIERHNVPVPER